MARKRKKNQSKEALLQELEDKTARRLKGQMSGGWRDNLFEVIMTRLELAAPHKKTLAAIPSGLLQAPGEAPDLARIYCGALRNMLKLAKAPATPAHVAAFGVLYATIIDVFLKDATKDHAKTMAAVDKRLGWFEQFAGYIPCK